MSNCPNCGSGHVTLKKETNVSWGRAVAGWALLGVVGGAVGAVTGEDRNVNACLDCGTSWKAADLYRILQVVQELTGKPLDLAKEKDRICLNSFLTEISPCLEAVSIAEEKAKKIIKKTNSLVPTTRSSFICLYLFVGFVVGSILHGLVRFVYDIFSTGTINNSISDTLVIMTFWPPVIGFILYGIFTEIKDGTPEKIEQMKRNAKREADEIKKQAEEKLKFAVREFTNRRR